MERSEDHLPQTLNEEAIADEFSDWEQVSFRTAERFAPGIQPSLADAAPDSPSPLHPTPSCTTPLFVIV